MKVIPKYLNLSTQWITEPLRIRLAEYCHLTIDIGDADLEAL